MEATNPLSHTSRTKSLVLQRDNGNSCGRQLTRPGFDLHHQVRGKKSGGGPDDYALPAQQGGR